MREYIVLRARALESTMLESEPRQKVLEWIVWAKQYVERIDPLKARLAWRRPKNQHQLVDESGRRNAWIGIGPQLTSCFKRH
jgi:hypothetical protein